MIWRLKKNVVWHDGAPFTADDVIFNWTFSIDPANATSSRPSFEEVSRIEKLDSHTVKVVYKKPQPFWGAVFTSGGLLPRHVFEPLKGAGRATPSAWSSRSGPGRTSSSSSSPAT